MKPGLQRKLEGHRRPNHSHSILTRLCVALNEQLLLLFRCKYTKHSNRFFQTTVLVDPSRFRLCLHPLYALNFGNWSICYWRSNKGNQYYFGNGRANFVQYFLLLIPTSFEKSKLQCRESVVKFVFIDVQYSHENWKTSA